jgi:hypothetical protein
MTEDDELQFWGARVEASEAGRRYAEERDRALLEALGAKTLDQTLDELAASRWEPIGEPK